MTTDEYTSETERKIIRELQEENRVLRNLLLKKGITPPESRAFQAVFRDESEYDPDQGGRIVFPYLNKDSARAFFRYFWGRSDVFAKRGKNGGYYPKCRNAFHDGCRKQENRKADCKGCPLKEWMPINSDILLDHLLGMSEDGTDAIGLYPLLPDGTCRFLAFDFDNHAKGTEKTDFANTDEQWKDEVDALRLVLIKNGIDHLVERSRSGRGAHIWIFFQEPIEASLARRFGTGLLERGYREVSFRAFKYFDRMFPNQDYVDSDGLGNLIALPLQGRPLRNGNTAFVDENWNAYENQWQALLRTEKLSKQKVLDLLQKWNAGNPILKSGLNDGKRLEPWNRDELFQREDVEGSLHITLADGVYVDALNLNVRLQNQLRSLATFRNPVFYKKLRMKKYTGYDFRTVYLGQDIDGYIRLPRGVLDELTAKCKEVDILYDIRDRRQAGKPLRVRFKGELRPEQEIAVQSILHYDNGILNAATAFGKTVVCADIIAEKKVNTLILLESTSLMQQWVDALTNFLEIDEALPTYTTKTGRVKTRTSPIGTLRAGSDKLTGIIDVAMIGSLCSRGVFNERLSSYGLVLMDECHHAASATAQAVLQQVSAKYVYGVTATPVRGDQLEKINYMLLGPIRHEFTAAERAERSGIRQVVIPRFTRLLDPSGTVKDINHAYELTRDSKARNEQIISDVTAVVKEGRTPVILTKYKEHAEYFAEVLKDCADHVFLLFGGNTPKQEADIISSLKAVPDDETVILVATAQKIGEGFDYPRLDTLFLAVPVSFSGRLSQYVGRLARTYEGKRNVAVYDYVDPHLPVFDNMYNKRLATYKNLGFIIACQERTEKQQAESIYNGWNYLDTFERDLNEADRQIIIASPELTQDKVDRLISVLKERQEAGVEVVVITASPDEGRFSDSSFVTSMSSELQQAGIMVRIQENLEDHYSVIDGDLVWYGGMNLLGKADAWDNLIRVKDAQAAAELLEMSIGKESCGD